MLLQILNLLQQDLMESLHTERELKDKFNSINDNYELHGYTNLVFEGGGAKMAAYVGAVKVNWFQPNT